MRSFVPALLLLAGCAEPPPPETPPPPPPAPVAAKPADVDRGALVTRHWIDHTRRCGDRCRYRKRGKSSIALDLFEDGRAEVTAQGQLLETFRATTGKRRQNTDWERRWSGRWKETGADEMKVVLRQKSLSCERAGATGTEDAPCEEVEKLVLRCRRLRIRLDHDHRPNTSWTWTCRSAPRTSIEFPMLPWVFSDDGEVAAIDVGVDESWKRKYLRPKRGTPPAR